MRVLRLKAVVAAAVVTAGGLSAGVSGTGSATAAPAPWHVASYFSRLGVTMDRVSCSSTAHCTAVEAGRLVSTADGGATWTDRTALVPAGAVELTDVACPTDTRCYLTAVVDGGTPVVYRVDDGTLATTSAVGTTRTLPTIDCPTADICVTTDGPTLYATHDAGATWTPRPLATPLLTTRAFDEPKAGRGLAVSCASGTESCAVLGNARSGAKGSVVAESTTDAGRHWTTTTLLAGNQYVTGLVSVDCVSSARCNAVVTSQGQTGTYTSTAGGFEPVTGAAALGYTTIVSCGGPTSCTAVGPIGDGRATEPVGSRVAATTDFATWTTLSFGLGDAIVEPSVNAAAVSCSTASSCVIVSDGAATRSTDGGATWTTVELPSARRTLERLDCPTVTRCVGVGRLDWAHPYVAVTGAPAGPWTRSDLPAGPGRLLDLDCPTTLVCYASRLGLFDGTTQADGQVVRTTDGGRTWTSTTLQGANLTHVSCPGATTCLASSVLTPRLRRTANAGARWVTVAPPSPPGTLLVTACGSPTSCVVDAMLRDQSTTAWTTPDLGATWVQHPLAYAGRFGDCSEALCVLSGDFQRPTPAVSTDGGATWTISSTPPGGIRLADVSCGSPTACAVSGTSSTAPVIVSTTDAGATWHVSALPPLPNDPQLSTVACARSTCFLAGQDAYGRPVLLTGPA